MNQGVGHDQFAVFDEIRDEFFDDAIERLRALEFVLDNGSHGRITRSELIGSFRRLALYLRGQAAGFGLNALFAIAHKLDEYLADAPETLPPRIWADLETYIDELSKQVGSRGTEIHSDFSRLPPKLASTLDDIEIRRIEVMLVTPHGAQSHFVERELRQCGYRTSVVPDTVLALSMVVQTKPDLIIISAVMPGLDGIDFAIGLSAMPSTRNIAVAVITSLDRDADVLTLLPKKVPVIFKGPNFADDLFKALDSLFMI